MKVAVVLIVIAIQLHFATAPPSPGVWGSIGKGFSWVGKKVFRIAPKVAPKVVQPSVTVAQKAAGPKLTTALTKWQKLLPKRSSRNSLFKTFARKLKIGTKAKYIVAAAATNKFARKIGSRSQVFRRYTKRTFQKLMRKIKNKVNPKGKGKVRADDEMATPLLRDELGETTFEYSSSFRGTK